jgi:hypothetical protein
MNFFNKPAKVHAMPSPSDELRRAAHAAQEVAKKASKQKDYTTRVQLREALSEFSNKLNEREEWYFMDPPAYYQGNGDSELIKLYLVWYEHLKTIYENNYNDKLNGGGLRRKKQSKSRRKQTKRKKRSIKSRRNHKR